MHQMSSFKDLLFTIRVHPRWKVFVSNYLKRIRNSALESIRFFSFLNENEYPQRYFYDFEPYQVAGFTPGDFLSKRLPVKATSCRTTAKREITSLAQHLVSAGSAIPALLGLLRVRRLGAQSIAALLGAPPPR